MSFHVGQKVVCVDATSRHWSRRWISEGVVYVVAGLRFDGSHEFKDHLGSTYALDLEGVGKPNGFGASRFRPLVERKTDISVFTAMLDRQKVPA